MAVQCAHPCLFPTIPRYNLQVRADDGNKLEFGPQQHGHTTEAKLYTGGLCEIKNRDLDMFTLAASHREEQ